MKFRDRSCLDNRRELLCAGGGILVRSWPALEPKEGIAVPVGTRDGLRDGGERAISVLLPCESILEDRHVVSRALPFSDQTRAGLYAWSPQNALLVTFVDRLID